MMTTYDATKHAHQIILWGLLVVAAICMALASMWADERAMTAHRTKIKTKAPQVQLIETNVAPRPAWTLDDQRAAQAVLQYVYWCVAEYHSVLGLEGGELYCYAKGADIHN